MNTASACTICSEHTHKSSKCPELWADTKEGFYSGGGSNRDYGGEDDSISDRVLTQLLDTPQHNFSTTRWDLTQDNGNPAQ